VTADPPAVRIATSADASFVCDLQRRYSNELGFLPTMAVNWYIDNGRVLLRQLNGQEAGYLLGRSHLRCQPWVAPLTQTAISFDAQLRDLGRSLVEHAAVTAAADGRSILQAWCRVDLQANEFWRALGFTAVGIRRPNNQRQQPLLLWRRPLDHIGRSRLLILPTAAGFRAVTTERRRILTPADRLMFTHGGTAA
jgi:N-acetylglutamate synthase-like GNAT family acetyltransferase